MASAFYVDVAAVDNNISESAYLTIANLALDRAGGTQHREDLVQLIKNPPEILPDDQMDEGLSLLHTAMRTLGIFCTLIPNSMIYIGDFIKTKRRDLGVPESTDAKFQKLGTNTPTRQSDLWETATVAGGGDCDELNSVSSLAGALTLVSRRWTTELMEALRMLAVHYVSTCNVCTVSRPAVGSEDVRGSDKIFIDGRRYKGLVGGGHFTHLLIPTAYFEQCVSRANPSRTPLSVPYAHRDKGEKAWWLPHLQVITCEGTGKLDPLQMPVTSYAHGRSRSPSFVDRKVGKAKQKAMRKALSLQLVSEQKSSSFKMRERMRRESLKLVYRELEDVLGGYWSTYAPQPHDADQPGLSLSSFFREFTHAFTFQLRAIMTSHTDRVVPVEFLYVQSYGDNVESYSRKEWKNGVNYRHILSMSERVNLVSVPPETDIESGVINMHNSHRPPLLHPSHGTSARGASAGKTIVTEVMLGGGKTYKGYSGLPKIPAGHERVCLYAKTTHLLQIKDMISSEIHKLVTATQNSKEISGIHFVYQPIAHYRAGSEEYITLSELCMALDVSVSSFERRVSPRRGSL